MNRQAQYLSAGGPFINTKANNTTASGESVDIGGSNYKPSDKSTDSSLPVVSSSSSSNSPTASSSGLPTKFSLPPTSDAKSSRCFSSSSIFRCASDICSVRR